MMDLILYREQLLLLLDKFRVVSVKIDKIDKTNKNDTENSERN